MPESPKDFLKKVAPRGKHERWCFTDYELLHPQNCLSGDPFVAYISDDELRVVDEWAAGHTAEFGVLVLRRGEVTNRWGDGTLGVPETVKQYVDWVDTLTKPAYYAGNQAQNEDDEVAHTWRDVLCDEEEGRFVRFLEPEKAIDVIEHELHITD